MIDMTNVKKYKVSLCFTTLGDSYDIAYQNAQEVVHDINRRAAIILDIDKIEETER